MKEELFFLTVPTTSHKIFCHVHCPALSNQEAFFFFNPILDEKQNVQKFQVQAARNLCNLNYFVIRFDYFGTGDSAGELYEMDFYKTLLDIEYLFDYILKEYNVNSIKLLGVRFGADLAAVIATKFAFISILFLIEPIIKGLRYLIEQRFRRKMFFRITGIPDREDLIGINGRTFEDFQGCPLSTDVLKFIGDLNLDEISFKNKSVFIYSISTTSKKLMNNVVSNLSVSNKIILTELNCPEFWTTAEAKNMTILIDEIINSLTL